MEGARAGATDRERGGLDWIARVVRPGPVPAALVALVLAAPIPTILAVAMFEIEPLQGVLKAWFTMEDGLRQSGTGVVVLSVGFLLLPVAAAIALVPAVRAARAERAALRGLAAMPGNVVVGVAILAVFVAILGGAIVDQLPCFMGQPNCD